MFSYENHHVVVVKNTDTRLDTELLSRRGCLGGRGLGGRGRGDAAGLRTHVLAVRRDGPHTWPGHWKLWLVVVSSGFFWGTYLRMLIYMHDIWIIHGLYSG